ncbi:LytTR family DNA-binding domain-containing protein [Puniceicoccaceae bacterium K14]|nr:LytTR family DNA-binding domain-containing protein [Puniceicoccaceae bacterium K14]
MHIAIVEDEAKVAQRLERLSREILDDRISQITRCASLESAVETITQKPIDLVFLDLNLNGQDGFELLKQAASSAFQTIIVSAHSEQAIKAFEFGVIDFVAKPFTKERLTEAIEKVTSPRAQPSNSAKQLAFRINNKLILRPLEDVLFMKGSGSYTEITFSDKQTLLHNKSLQALEMILPKPFQRIHKSYIANFSVVREVTIEPNHKYSLKIDSETSIPIGRSRYQTLKSEWLY